MINGNRVALREKRLEDAAADYTWKRDPEVSRLDASLPLEIPFHRYLMDYSEELRHTNSRSCRFAIETLEGQHIGNCSYYDIDEDRKETEIGIVIGDKNSWGKGYGTDAIITLLNHIFHNTRIERVYLHTLEDNLRAQQCFHKCGFVCCGREVRGWHTFLVMEIRRNWLTPVPQSPNPSS